MLKFFLAMDYKTPSYIVNEDDVLDEDPEEEDEDAEEADLLTEGDGPDDESY